jgi:bifunctional DNA primase/polymerase-like protein/primase-like protein
MSLSVMDAATTAQQVFKFPSPEKLREYLAGVLPAALNEELNQAVAAVFPATEQTVTAEQPTATVQGEHEPTTFELRAFELTQRNVPVIPLRPGTKIAFIKEWENLATTERAKTKEWGQEFPDANCAAVAQARPGGTWFFEIDRPGLEQQIEELTGQKIPKTFTVQSRPGRSHYYFRQNATSIAMGNRQAKDQQGELWSARVADRYVVGPLSVHPDTQKEYEIIQYAPIVEAPDWLIEYCQRSVQQDVQHEPVVEKTTFEDDGVSPITEGSRNNTLTSILGRKRQKEGWDAEQLYEYGLTVNQRCKPPLSDNEVRTIARSVGKYEVVPTVPARIGGYTPEAQKVIQEQIASNASETAIPIIDDPSDDDPRFEMKGDYFDTKVYEDISKRFTPYPDPGNGDWISQLSKKLVTGTPIPLAYVREPLKAIVLHAIDGKVIHHANTRMTMRGNYFSLGESESGKTTGLEYALRAAELIFSSSLIHPESLFRYKSEQTFIRSFTPEGTIKRDTQGNIKSGHAGHPSQFLYIKEGNLVANSSDYFAAVFAMLTNLYDQTEAGTESMTNGDFTASVARASTVMCFTPTDYKATFGGKGNIGGGGLNRWGITNPPEDHSYDDKDWKPLSDAEIQKAIAPLGAKVFELRQHDPIVLTEEEGAAKIRLEIKAMLKKAGKAGKRLLEYFMREQVAMAATSVDGRSVMTTKQAQYAREWVMAQLDCRLSSWPSDANNQIEAMEHAIRKVVSTHHVSEKKLKDACNFYREGSGGWFIYNSARKNMLDSGAIKWTGKTRKGTKTYCPGMCAVHSAVEEEE